MPCNSPVERASFWDAILKELPGFIHFLQNWEIPEELTDSRFGICAYHHPDIVKVVEEMSPERRLLELIEATVLIGGEFRGHVVGIGGALALRHDFWPSDWQVIVVQQRPPDLYAEVEEGPSDENRHSPHRVRALLAHKS